MGIAAQGRKTADTRTSELALVKLDGVKFLAAAVSTGRVRKRKATDGTVKAESP